MPCVFLLATGGVFKKEKVAGEVLVKKKAQGRPLLQTQEWQYVSNRMPPWVSPKSKNEGSETLSQIKIGILTGSQGDV